MIPIGEWLPDQPALNNPGALEALNVIPATRSYRPLPSFAPYSGALSGRAQGAFYTRKSNGDAAQFAGDAGKLYRLAGTNWVDASRTTGGAYGTPPDGSWQFAQFGPLAVAVNGFDPPQKFNLDTDSNFSALGGTPPSAGVIATVRDFLVFGRIGGALNRVQWSGINDAESWTPDPATQADWQDFPDGGFVQAIAGGEIGIVLQERAIKRMTYVGPPAIFQFDEVARAIGATVEGSVAAHGDRVFFCHRSGFYMLAAGQGLMPIGSERVNKTFWADLDQNHLVRVTAAVDPVNELYVVCYPGAGNVGGTPNKLLLYRWTVDRWSRAEPGAVELVYAGTSQQGYTLEQLDTVASTLEALPISLDSAVWTGIARPLFAGFDAAHRLGYFNGPNLAATVDTAEAQLVQGRRALVRAVRPMLDGGAVTVRVGTRNLPGEGVQFGAAVAVNGLGAAPVRASARYHRARLTVAAGGSWTHLQGVEVDAAPEGGR